MKDTNGKQVKARLKVHLLQGKSITPNQALRMWRTSRLATYVLRLRHEGMDIITTMKTENGDTFAEYSLAKRPKVDRIATRQYLQQ